MKISILLTLLSLSCINIHSESINLSKSSFTWTGTKLTGDFHSGSIKMKKAVLDNGKGELVADMSSIDVSTLKGSWKTKFLDHIKGEDFFEIKKYPEAKLLVKKQDKGYLYGTLTIKNKSHDVKVPFTKDNKVYSGEISFDRTKYNIIYGSGNFFKGLGDKVISDTVKLKFNIVLK